MKIFTSAASVSAFEHVLNTFLMALLMTRYTSPHVYYWKAECLFEKVRKLMVIVFIFNCWWWFTRRMHSINRFSRLEPWCHSKLSRTLLHLTVHNSTNKRRITSNVFQYFCLFTFHRDGKSNLTSHLWLSWWAHDSFRKHSVKNEVRGRPGDKNQFLVQYFEGCSRDDIKLKVHKIHCYLVLPYDRHSAAWKNLRRLQLPRINFVYQSPLFTFIASS